MNASSADQISTLAADYCHGRVAWIGGKPSVGAEPIELWCASNGRVSPEFHQQFDVIWFYETPIFNYSLNWRLALDEILRLAAAEAVLVLRSVDQATGTLFELKSKLYRHPSFDCSLLKQVALDDGSTVSVIRIKRENLPDYRSNRWSVGILSNGQKNKNIKNLIVQMIRLAEGRAIEFIICGPAFDIGLDCDHAFINLAANDSLPRVGEKKDLITKTAKYENVALFHDRYCIGDDFFSGFDLYGYDFDFVTVRQSYESGAFFPGYVGFKKPEMRWQSPSYSKDSRVLFEGHYLNGGLMIIKRHIALCSSINPLLLHNEAEDVELGFVLAAQGITPRVNLFSSAVTVGVPDTYTSTFRLVASSNGKSKRQLLVSYLLRVWLLLPSRLKVSMKRSKVFEKAKNMLLD